MTAKAGAVDPGERGMSGSYRCPDCGEKWVNAFGLDRHRAKPHTQCPLCWRKMIRLDPHLSWHYWQEVKPMVRMP